MNEEPSALYAAARDRNERTEPISPSPYRPLSADERAKVRQDARARHLRDAGLQRLSEGVPCTPAQAPFVGAHVKVYEARIADLERQLRAKEADFENEQERLGRIIEEWNEVWTTLDALGIHLYERRGHEWDGQATDGTQGHGDHYASISDALKAALLWRLSQK